MFSLFGSLPTELRLKIFEHAAHGYSSRFIELRTSCHPLGISYQPLDSSVDPIHGKVVNVSDVVWECRTRNPPLLSVSREARAAGRRERWRVRFELDLVGARESHGQEQSGGQVVYIDPSSDIVYANLKWAELFDVLVNDLLAFGIVDRQRGAQSLAVSGDPNQSSKKIWNLALHTGFISSFYPSLMSQRAALRPESLANFVVIANPAWAREPYWEKQGNEEARLGSPREETGEMIITEGLEKYLVWLKPTKWEGKLIRRDTDVGEKEEKEAGEDNMALG
ncbi:MAG: hypothetical protein Q9160_006657 [Pyrenula sp. 1 TL-2023]